MLQLFQRKNNQIASALIVLFTIGLHLIAFQKPLDFDVWNHAAPLASAIFNSAGFFLVENKLVNFIVSLLLIFVQLISVYRIISLIRNIENYALLGTWLYAFIIHLFPYWSFFSPVLLGSTALLLIIYLIFKDAETKSNLFVFHISFLIGIVFMLWYPSILWLFYFANILFFYNTLTLQRIIIIFLTFLIPLINYISFNIFVGKEMDVLFQFSNFHIQGLYMQPDHIGNVIIIGIFALFSILGFLQAIQLSQKTNKQTRLFFNSMLLLLIVVSASFFLSVNLLSYSIVFLLLPISLYLSFSLNIFKRKLFSEIAHLILILLIVVHMIVV